MQEALHQFVSHLGVLSSHIRQRQLSDVNSSLDSANRERDWVTFAQELYLTQGVGLIQFDRVSAYFSHLCDAADAEWVINKPFDAYEEKTMIHLETMSKQNALLKVLLNMGSMLTVTHNPLWQLVSSAAINCNYQLLIN